MSLKIGPVQSISPITQTTTFDRSEVVQSDQQAALDMALNTISDISQQNDLIDATTIVEMQHSTVEENTIANQELSTNLQIENEAKGTLIFI